MLTRKHTVGAAVLILLGFAVLWLFGSLVARPATWSVEPPAAPGKVIHLRASDGTAIEASYWPGTTPDGPAVLLLHGIGASREMFADHVAWLNGLGYAVLAPDFRGHGASAAAARSFGWREADDAAAAFAFLRKDRRERKIGVIGVSLGGAAALLGDDGPLPADAMVLQAVYPHLRTAIRNRIATRLGVFLGTIIEPLLSFQAWPRYDVAPGRIAPANGLERFGGSVLIIGGSEDVETKPEDTRELFDAARGPKSLWLIDGADHPETCSFWSATYRARVQAFFQETLGRPNGNAPLPPAV